jgi:thiosulfate reductase cytochrome b subunit
MRHFRYFLPLAEELNFSRASKRCNVTQPSLSSAIKRLDQERGGLLFRRKNASTHLIDAMGMILRVVFPTRYNTVQKLLYVGVLLVGVMVAGLAIWKPIQFSELVGLLGGFQNARLVHFVCMSAIVGFVLVHVSLALPVPHTLVAMITGGPRVNTGPGTPAPVQLNLTR